MWSLHDPVCPNPFPPQFSRVITFNYSEIREYMYMRVSCLSIDDNLSKSVLS